MSYADHRSIDFMKEISEPGHELIKINDHISPAGADLIAYMLNGRKIFMESESIEKHGLAFAQKVYDGCRNTWIGMDNLIAVFEHHCR